VAPGSRPAPGAERPGRPARRLPHAPRVRRGMDNVGMKHGSLDCLAHRQFDGVVERHRELVVDLADVVPEWGRMREHPVHVIGHPQGRLCKPGLFHDLPTRGRRQTPPPDQRHPLHGMTSRWGPSLALHLLDQRYRPEEHPAHRTAWSDHPEAQHG
jgi:hypothetical protein